MSGICCQCHKKCGRIHNPHPAEKLCVLEPPSSRPPTPTPTSALHDLVKCRWSRASMFLVCPHLLTRGERVCVRLRVCMEQVCAMIANFLACSPGRSDCGESALSSGLWGPWRCHVAPVMTGGADGDHMRHETAGEGGERKRERESACVSVMAGWVMAGSDCRGNLLWVLGVRRRLGVCFRSCRGCDTPRLPGDEPEE